ncbi:uncharacterized protein [Typha latifolia]|uniref:uncharacterized protein isoform X1 n=1 Tax=Typha latifolia TaxID=4733 RepID=UPI003C2ECC70
MASLLLEQQEKLRRVVDEWRYRAHDLLSGLHGDPFTSPSSSSSSTTSSSDPVRLHVEPIEHCDLSSLLDSDNVAVSKFLMVLSHDCLEISRLSQFASKNLYRQLLLFGHRSSPQEVLLEGEPQKAFGRALPLFVQLYETVNGMTAVLGNLLQQLNAIYSLHDKNVRPLNSFKSSNLRTVFESFGNGLAMFLVLDEILKQNGNIKNYLSLFVRMLTKVKREVDMFGITFDDLDFLDRIVVKLDKLFVVGFFQRLMQTESPWHVQLSLIRCNKKFLDACSSCFHDTFSEILRRLDSWKELPADRRKILDYVALFLFSTHASGEVPEKRIGKLLIEMFHLVPLIYVEGGKRIILSDVVKSQCHQALSSWPPLAADSKEFGVMKSTYLMRLSDLHSRDWQAIKDSLSCWAVSFQSNVHPSSEMLSEEWVRLLMKQILQGVLLANRLHMLVISMLDLHALLEVPLRREKMKSLCHMIISLKVIGDIVHIKGPNIMRSLPHVLNIIQKDIEQFIIPLKGKIESEIAKGSQTSKMGFLSSLTRGGKEVDTKLTDSLTLVLISLQLLEGGGNYKRQLIFSITMDILQSIGALDIDFLRIRKFTSKLETVAEFQSIIEGKTNCSFLYWRKEMIGTWLSMMYADANILSWLQYILDAFSDGLWFLKLGHVGKFTLQSYEEEIEDTLKSEIIAPLCRDIETDLRLHVHSTHLKGSVSVNPTKTGVQNLSWYLRMKMLRLPFKIIDLNMLVESYLNAAFYSHSLLTTYDVKIYSVMRQLGELKYGLELDDFHLTEFFIDQDFDVFRIVRKLNIFVEDYSYNIVKQMFIESDPNNQKRKNLRVIHVEHVASSLAMYGLRSVSAASDSVLKFLTEMFTDLSELLKDDIEIELLKDSYSKNNKGALNTRPFRQGELKFALGKFAVGGHGVTFPQQVQSVITRIGNALGLMRILLAGCSRYSCSISWYAKRSNCDLSFWENCKKLSFIDEIVAAGRIMDTAITKKYQLDDGVRSFSVFIAMFKEKLQSIKFGQFKDFFHIVPSIIAHIVDSRLLEKDKLLRRDHELGSMVNLYDGFVMGIVFVLKVLGQEKSFDELHWFASIKKKLEEEIPVPEDSSKLLEKRTSSSGLAGLKLWQQTPSTSTEVQKGLEKSKRYENELEIIECGLKIARTIMS